MKRIVFTVLICISLSLIGCKSKQKRTEQTPMETPAPTISVQYSHFDERLIQYPVSERISWAYYHFPGISVDTQNEINRILYEKGFDCQIDFISTDGYVGNEYTEWLDMYEKNRPNDVQPLDIITSGSWMIGEAAEEEFLMQWLVPLNNYLNSQDGKALMGTYTQDEWMQTTRNGNIYVVPRAAYGMEGNWGLDMAAYLCVDEQYADYFENFDGTYASLRAIYDLIGDESLRIVTEEIGLIEKAGCASLLNMTFAYDQKNRTAVPFSEMEEVPELLIKIYSDLVSGVLIYQPLSDGIDGNVLASYCRGSRIPKEGYRLYQLAPYPYEFNCKMSYGISTCSSKKDLAFKVLSECLSNPDILCLLYPGSEITMFENRTKILNSVKTADVPAGISFTLNTEQIKLVNDYVTACSGLCFSMYYRLKPEDPLTLNPDWDLEESWKEFIGNTKEISSVCDVINVQIQEWIQEQGTVQ